MVQCKEYRGSIAFEEVVDVSDRRSRGDLLFWANAGSLPQVGESAEEPRNELPLRGRIKRECVC